MRKAARQAKSAIRQLAVLKAEHSGRPLCGILLIEHIGDIIACEPVIDRMRNAHPDALIVWVVRQQYRELLAGHPRLDAIVVVNSLLSVERIVHARVLDITVDLHVNAKVTEVEGRYYNKTAGNAAITVDSYLRQGSLLESFSRAADIAPQPAAPTLYVSREAAAVVDRLSVPNHFVVVHTTSNYAPKDWTIAAWSELVRYLLDNYETHVIEIGLKCIVDVDHPRFIRLCGKLSIIQTAELIRRSAFFIGIDSGPAHMANAWQRPGLVLFSRYAGLDDFNPFDGFYRDNADKILLRYPGRLQEQPVSRVIDALEASPLWRDAIGERRRVATEARLDDAAR